MILPLLFGVGLLIWGGIHFRKYFLFVTGIKMKGTVTKAEYKEQGIGRKVHMTEITYRYEVKDKEYTHTEISDEEKHLFKPQSMKGESIALMVWKKSPEISTCRSSGHYLKSSIFFLVIGLLSTLVGIAGM
ncbi:hypothetical protein SAMN05421766_102200 [Zobellia uliginosa]|uniref:DUF3592 domain-containing protein n=1 Tax=Zobellia uliginosa TaxID=143224 RepID=A0ABY1KLQ5_9FLAO|nr:DUF3592 domain-containing protein [Zobellia uliginosa]SIS47997.1 hypothetical protein SAMN05421766_102200 [Zobellia uliginosa]